MEGRWKGKEETCKEGARDGKRMVRRDGRLQRRGERQRKRETKKKVNGKEMNEWKMERKGKEAATEGGEGKRNKEKDRVGGIGEMKGKGSKRIKGIQNLEAKDIVTEVMHKIGMDPRMDERGMS